MKLPLILLAGFAAAVTAVTNKDCTEPEIHARTSRRDLHASYKVDPKAEYSWARGRIYCKSKCMDLVSLDDQETWDAVKNVFHGKNQGCFLIEST